MPGGKNVIVSGRFYMGNSINGLAVARFSVNVNVTVYITVNVAAPQHAACQRQPIYELLSPVAASQTLNSPPSGGVRGGFYKKQRGVILIG